MPFNTITFGVFLPIVLLVYWTVPARLRNAVLLASSYVFYGWWDWRFLSLLWISTAVDFTIGRLMERTIRDQHRLRLLLVSVAVNLGILGVFKYLEFFADSTVRLFGVLGLEADSVTLDIVLPVGISFYTFQTISYSFDVYRRRIAPTHNLVDFACYVAYFPQLVAGPIERAQRLLPQMVDHARRFPDAGERVVAARLILLGLAKKVVLADGVAPIVNDAFADSATASWVTLVAGVVGFAIQIYGDFSGYTDIARGVSKLLGIELVVNFAEPYLSRNITEFWRRWHISLSDWLRDYLYIPLGGNRNGTFATYRNLMVTMLLGGLWHGASWNFVVWGGLHGLFLVGHRLVRSGVVSEREPVWSDVPAIVLTNIGVLLAWVFFRAETFTEAGEVIGGIVTTRSGAVDWSDIGAVVLFAGATIGLDLWQRRGHRLPVPVDAWAAPLARGVAVGSVIAAIVLFSGGTAVPFIYFQF